MRFLDALSLFCQHQNCSYYLSVPWRRSVRQVGEGYEQNYYRRSADYLLHYRSLH